METLSPLALQDRLRALEAEKFKGPSPDRLSWRPREYAY